MLRKTRKAERIFKLIFATTISSSLIACGGGGSDSGPPGSQSILSDAPNTLSVAFPIEAATDLENGFYQVRGSLGLTDAEGNAVADGTRVNLYVIDSLKATGTITAGVDTITGATLTDAAPLLSDGTATQFDTASIFRNLTQEFVAPGDLLLLFNANRADQVRRIRGTTNTTVDSSNAFSTNYPNTVFDGLSASRTTTYSIGSSSLGAYIQGAGGTQGYVTTKDGIAEFTVTYPAGGTYQDDVGTLYSKMNAGCVTGDTRFPPNDSAQTYIVATVEGNPSINAIDPGFCFAPIAGGTIEVSPESISGPSGTSRTVRVTLRDGGQGFRVPFGLVGIGVDSSGGAGVSPGGNISMNEFGFEDVSFTISGTSGDTATVTFSGNRGATGTLTVSIE